MHLMTALMGMNSTIGGKCGHLRRICGQIHLFVAIRPELVAIFTYSVAIRPGSVAKSTYSVAIRPRFVAKSTYSVAIRPRFVAKSAYSVAIRDLRS